MADRDLIALLPLERTWLADAIEVMLHRPNGIAEADVLVIEIGRLGRDLRKTPKETITRTLNDWTVNAGDTVKEPRGALFERIDRSTWRLLSWPQAPDLIELQDIRFADEAYKRTWDFFVEKVREKPDAAQKWDAMTKRARLELFAEKLLAHEGLRNLLTVYGGTPPEIPSAQ